MSGVVTVKKAGAYEPLASAGAKIKVGGTYVDADDLKIKANGVYGGGVAPPVNTVPPVVTGTPQSSNTLTCSTGTWAGADSISFRWYRDDTPMIGQQGSNLTVIPPYVGSVIYCGVTAANQGGSETAFSNSVTIVP